MKQIFRIVIACLYVFFYFSDINFKAAVWRRIQRQAHKRLQIHLCVEMQRINGTPFMRQKCTPSPHKQPQVNVMDLSFCIKGVINILQHELFHLVPYSSNNTFDPRDTRGPWWPYIAHLKNIAFGQDCFTQLKYITMTKVYVVLILWNIILYHRII